MSTATAEFPALADETTVGPTPETTETPFARDINNASLRDIIRRTTDTFRVGLGVVETKLAKLGNRLERAKGRLFADDTFGPSLDVMGPRHDASGRINEHDAELIRRLIQAAERGWGGQSARCGYLVECAFEEDDLRPPADVEIDYLTKQHEQRAQEAGRFRLIVNAFNEGLGSALAEAFDALDRNRLAEGLEDCETEKPGHSADPEVAKIRAELDTRERRIARRQEHGAAHEVVEQLRATEIAPRQGRLAEIAKANFRRHLNIVSQAVNPADFGAWHVLTLAFEERPDLFPPETSDRLRGAVLDAIAQAGSTDLLALADLAMVESTKDRRWPGRARDHWL